MSENDTATQIANGITSEGIWLQALALRLVSYLKPLHRSQRRPSQALRPPIQEWSAQALQTAAYDRGAKVVYGIHLWIAKCRTQVAGESRRMEKRIAF